MDGKSPFMKDVMKDMESQSAEFALVCTLTSTFSSTFNPESLIPQSSGTDNGGGVA
jgi:hypothetical protein